MIEDYYKILNINPKASLYKIALHYKINSMKAVGSHMDIEDLRKEIFLINCAFEVLKNEHVRIYYDVLYKVFVQNKQLGIDNQTVEKYLSIVNHHIEKGKMKAERIINDKQAILPISIRRPLILSFLLGTIKLYMRYPRFTTSPLAGFLFIALGLFINFRAYFGIMPDLWFLGLIFLFGGIISVYVNFQCFTIDLMNNEK